MRSCSLVVLLALVSCGGGHGGTTDGQPAVDSLLGDIVPCPGHPTELCSTTHCDNDQSHCVNGWDCETSSTIDDRCVCTPATETCNDKDDDCDGIVDTPATTDLLCVAENGTGYGCDRGNCIFCPARCDLACTELAADVANCGGCGHACATGGTCSDAGCKTVTVLGPGDRATAIAVDDQVLVWTDHDNNLYRCALPDCAGGPTLLTNTEYFGGALALVGHTIYFARSNTLASCSETGPCATPTTINATANVTGGISIEMIAAADHLYWLTDNANAIGACTAASCTATSATIVAAAAGDTIANLASDGTTIAWVEYPSQGGTRSVFACPATGCPGSGPTLLATSPTIEDPVALHAGRVYWSDAVHGFADLRSCAADGSCATPTDHGPIQTYGGSRGIYNFFPLATGFAIAAPNDPSTNNGAILGCVATGCESQIEVLAAPLPSAYDPRVIAGSAAALYLGADKPTSSGDVVRIQ